MNDKLSLGAALGLNYSSSSQTLFPNTSDNSNPAAPFFGVNFKDASGYGFNGKFGLQYRPAEDVVIGVDSCHNRRYEKRPRRKTVQHQYPAPAR